MSDLNIIKEVSKLTAKRYEKLLEQLRPSQPDGEYLEQNIITNFAISFVQKFPNANIYTEIPFISNDTKGYWQNRLDLYIEHDDIGYIIEAKGSQAKDKLFYLIEEDIIRIKSSNMKKSFESMKKRAKSPLPKKIIGLVIADCWSGKNKNINKQEQKWINKDFDKNSFKNILELENVFSNEIKIKNSSYKYHMLIGLLKNPIWN
jgi:hypothetical protein